MISRGRAEPWIAAVNARLAWAKLESAPLTTAFWLTVGCFVAAWWVTPFPPAIDYPQHLAMGVMIRRLLDPSSPEHQLYVLQPLTYNGLFHFVIAGLSLVMPAEVAGKLLLSLIPVLTATSALMVVRWGRRPLWYAFFPLPLSYSYTVGWGFVNYSVVAPLVILLLVLWLRWRDGERRLLPWVVGLSLTVAYAHVLATLCLCVSVGVLSVVSRLPREVGLRRWLRDGVRWQAPILPAGLYCVAVYFVHRSAPHIYWEPDKEGADVPAWTKLRDLGAFAADNLSSDLDTRLFWALFLLLLALYVGAAFVGEEPGRTPRRELRWLTVTWFFGYLVVPRIAMSTWWIFERLPLFFVIFAAGAAPVLPVRRWLWMAPAAAMFALMSGANTLQAFARIPDARDADAIIDDIPEGARAIAVMFSPSGAPVLKRELWVHLLAYHVVRHRGEIGFDFTRYASLPVRRRDAPKPPRFPAPLEWMPEAFDPYADYAHYFDHVLVRTPDEAPDVDPRTRVFKENAASARVISRHGRFWLYDTSGSPF